MRSSRITIANSSFLAKLHRNNQKAILQQNPSERGPVKSLECYYIFNNSNLIGLF